LDRYITGATGIIHISNSGIKNLEIPIPPFPQQQRIVAILDDAFAKIEKAKANAEQNLKNVKELFESYLQGVFENKGDDWEEKKLIEITSKIGSGATPRGGNESYKSEGISLVRSMNVHDFEFREKNLAFIDDQQAKELNNVTLQENDVLLNITGASVARCCIIPREFLPARVNQHVSIIRAKKEIIDPIFLNLLLTSKFYKDQLLFTGEQGATRQAITKTQLEVFKIAFPKSFKEQKSLMKKLEALSLETKKLEAIYEQKIKDLDELKKSILQKAFSGSLI
jgi:type I restriction enzyme S subunit